MFKPWYIIETGLARLLKKVNQVGFPYSPLGLTACHQARISVRHKSSL
jgi:hypothetical protein